MDRLRVFYRQEAIADLEEVFRFILRASRSPAVAAAFVGRIRERCDKIGDAPHGGRPRGDLYPGLLTVPCERSAIIAYRVEADRVRIVNVFYGRQDYEALYGTARTKRTYDIQHEPVDLSDPQAARRKASFSQARCFVWRKWGPDAASVIACDTRGGAAGTKRQRDDARS